ncbi:MAG: hypothetical protein GY795_44155, partial [Desulfobacterales bacterium]|nr:hypothetical protein [Desulfobacterales bacterium]
MKQFFLQVRKIKMFVNFVLFVEMIRENFFLAVVLCILGWNIAGNAPFVFAEEGYTIDLGEDKTFTTLNYNEGNCAICDFTDNTVTIKGCGSQSYRAGIEVKINDNTIIREQQAEISWSIEHEDEGSIPVLYRPVIYDIEQEIEHYGLAADNKIPINLQAGKSYRFFISLGAVGPPCYSDIPGYIDFSLTIKEIRVSFFKSIDPLDYTQNSHLLDSNGQITQDINEIVNSDSSLNRGGVAADGVSKLILSIPAANPDDLYQISLPVNDEDNGCLMYLDSQSSNECHDKIWTTAVNTEKGSYALAIYQAPKSFSKTFNRESERSVELTLRNTSLDPSSVNYETTQSIKIRRPPVLLVHGVWSGPDTWGNIYNNPSSEYSYYRVNYSSTNANYFRENSSVIPLNIWLTLWEYKTKYNIASVQCDVVAHSMGAMLTRWYMSPDLQHTRYLRNENYNKGDIRKLITIGTPHSGSPIANWLYENRELEFVVRSPFLGEYRKSLKDLLASYEMPIDKGAVFDLAIPTNISNGTSQVNSQPEDNAKNHAIYTTIQNISGVIGDFINFLSWEDVFNGEGNDGVVPVVSQRGGLSDSQTTSGGDDILHDKQTGNVGIKNTIEELLNKPLDDPAFADSFKPETLTYAGRASRKLQYDEPTVFVQIISPATGINVLPGQTLTVTTQGNDGQPLSNVLFLTIDNSYIDDTPPFEFSFKIPDDVLGDYTIGAFGKDAGNGISYYDIQVNVQTNSSLTSINVIPEAIFFPFPDINFPLYVEGLFSDGIQRDISSSDKGTKYSSTDASVVTVDSEGILKPVKNGSSEIIIQNGDVFKSVNVIVELSGDVEPSTDYDLTIAVNQADSGATIPAIGTHPYAKDTVVNIEAVANSGYKFDHWAGDVANAYSASTTILIDSAKTVTAEFVPIEPPTDCNLTIAVNPEGSGSTIPGVGKHSYAKDTVVNIEAVANSGYKFDHWTGDAADAYSASTTIVMDIAKTVTAEFVLIEPPTDYDLTIGVNPADSGATTPAIGTHPYAKDTVVNIEAVANSGYKFDHWTGDVANAYSSSTTVTITDVKTVTAHFTAVNIPVIPGDVDNNGTVNLNDVILVLQTISKTSSENGNKKADMNWDGRIGIEETLYILQIIGDIRDVYIPEPGDGEISGIISSDTTWNTGTVKISGKITIADGVTLTIKPGTYIEFQGLHRLDVKGTLLAEGTADNPITFTAKDPNVGWNGIRFDNTPETNETSKLVHCRLEHATSVITQFDDNDNGGAVYISNFSNLVISDCTITNNNASGNGGGIYLYNSNPALTDNTVSDNTASYAGGIYLDHSTPLLTGNTITGNKASNYGGGICIDHSYTVMKNNTVTDNTASYAAGIYTYDSNVTMENNVISNNTASHNGGGIHFSYSSPNLANNLITDNKAAFGSGIFFDNSGGTLANITVSNNSSDGIYCNWNSSPVITNTILWGNNGP